ncbi:MAG: EamA family transporter [Hyphomicrobiales bacterium]
MKALPYIFAILFAVLAAIGNAIYAWGMKKAGPSSNPFVFSTCAFLFSTIITAIIALIMGKANFLPYFTANSGWILFAVLGFITTQVSFYLLYQYFGANQYTLYAVFSIITTSLIVGVFILGGKFNWYHFFALLTAIATVLLFVLGNKHS